MKQNYQQLAAAPAPAPPQPAARFGAPGLGAANKGLPPGPSGAAPGGPASRHGPSSGLDHRPPASPHPRCALIPGRAAGAGSTAGLAFPALLGKRCKVSDNAERRGFCADEIIDSY